MVISLNDMSLIDLKSYSPFYIFLLVILGLCIFYTWTYLHLFILEKEIRVNSVFSIDDRHLLFFWINTKHMTSLMKTEILTGEKSAVPV